MPATKLPRFHPLVTEFDGQVAWWVADSHANQLSEEFRTGTTVRHSKVPFATQEEAQFVCDTLNEKEPAWQEPQVKKTDSVV